MRSCRHYIIWCHYGEISLGGWIMLYNMHAFNWFFSESCSQDYDATAADADMTPEENRYLPYYYG